MVNETRTRLEGTEPMREQKGRKTPRSKESQQPEAAVRGRPALHVLGQVRKKNDQKGSSEGNAALKVHWVPWWWGRVKKRSSADEPAILLVIWGEKKGGKRRARAKDQGNQGWRHLPYMAVPQVVFVQNGFTFEVRKNKPRGHLGEAAEKEKKKAARRGEGDRRS